ncbi:MAG: MBL fold metallo-hydrolase [Muribaculum sp.]|nr:MBL fold metallo-hydrolase [Muribaculum sp.]
MLEIRNFTFNMFGVNTYVVWNPETKEAAIIDPGMINRSEEDQIDAFISDNHLNVTQLINTHMHLDHIFGDKWVTDKYGVKVKASTDDEFLGKQSPAQARMFSLPLHPQPVAVDEPLKDGDKLNIGGEEVDVLSVPGHSPGSIVLYFPSSGWAITGDVLFEGSIGRTDLVAGNHKLLIEGIHKKLFALPDSTIVFPGHGGPTTIGREKSTNPYL